MAFRTNLLVSHQVLRRPTAASSLLATAFRRELASAATQRRARHQEGDISDVFTTLGPQGAAQVLPQRFAELKRAILDGFGTSTAALEESWRQVCGELEVRAEEIKKLGGEAIPRIDYTDVEKGLSQDQVKQVKEAGVVVVSGAVPCKEALEWKRSIRDYVAANPSVRGYPQDNIQVYELYNTRAQMLARTHPAILNTQRALLEMWHSSSPEDAPCDFSTPVSYFDRVRIRNPGDKSFTLGPHVDGGSIERWEDTLYRRVYGNILRGGDSWKRYDPYDVRYRLNAKHDLYQTPNQCTALRCWQGWTSLSTTTAGEGTLRVLPMLSLSTAYIILRPFFRPRVSLMSLRGASSLSHEAWEVDLETPSFPGSPIRKGQELNEVTHPHLGLENTMISVPRIDPGDQVYWHCDTVHAVESVHGGSGDSSVMYIPAAPLCIKNAHYLRDQRETFTHGYPAPDFPGGEGESKFVNRYLPRHITTSEARQALGFEPFTSTVNTALTDEANKVLFG
ncbi:DUF1479-domain-containing protein [Coniophora puteana RWD-64-598 SS2]|uniref:DUF1479-domain-containing protein n=1 Tax=Coniophora puteana (strain RWD-64-598) TaxID=741705 RepID=A0A5M3MM26_CONPW|nr:DUF1479-domain-containing protein [Coniophora puteana RWD-64-598 SS2]EIW80163.1 DUF1479-domain-containing protein [Coniophora puteana RWD-64-598 SS2]